MVRKSKIEKINSIEDQIKELKQKQREMLDTLYMDIGKYVVSEWDCNNDAKLKELVDHFKSEALQILSSEENETLNSNEGSIHERERQEQI